MAPWFEKKLGKENLRKESLRRIDNSHQSFFRKLSITQWLIILNVIVYLLVFLTITFGANEKRVFSLIALQPNNFFSGSIWTAFTSMFTHIWLPHLIFNMISLLFLGNFLERIIGRKKFLWFYIFSGLVASIFYAALSYFFGSSDLGARIFVSPESYAVGASGAIFGLAGLLSVLTPFMSVYLIAGPIIAIVVQSLIGMVIEQEAILAMINFVITVYIFFSIFSMFSHSSVMRNIAVPIRMHFWILPIAAIVPLFIVGLFVELPIGNTAHLGGLIAGIFYGFYLKNKYKKKTAMISKYFSR
ncbi:rhomboid family intramembrane serine protease [Candidatus Pacearchaeota archaeon]|nr:rhomboid family intramembrane serine protease [Candidatus Pacearchaeota archaeon]